MHPVDSYRSCQSITTHPCIDDPLHRAEVGGQWSWPILATDWSGKISSIYLPSATKSQLQEEGVLSPHRVCTSSIQLGWNERLCHWTLQDTYYIRPHYQDMESKQLYLIHRKKHREAAKMKKHGPNERTDQNSRRRAKWNGEMQSIRCRVQDTSYKDAQGT